MKTRRFCPKCGRPVVKSKNKEYTFQCYNCEEDFCRFEVFHTSEITQEREIRKSYLDRSTIIQIL